MGEKMAQAKTLTQAEIDQVLRTLGKTRYYARNRLLVLTSFWSGMRVGEAIWQCRINNCD
jgi:integrase/recombinase XerD